MDPQAESINRSFTALSQVPPNVWRETKDREPEPWRRGANLDDYHGKRVHAIHWAP